MKKLIAMLPVMGLVVSAWAAEKVETQPKATDSKPAVTSVPEEKTAVGTEPAVAGKPAEAKKPVSQIKGKHLGKHKAEKTEKDLKQ